jgi:hypothetical protein
MFGNFKYLALLVFAAGSAYGQQQHARPAKCSSMFWGGSALEKIYLNSISRSYKHGWESAFAQSEHFTHLVRLKDQDHPDIAVLETLGFRIGPYRYEAPTFEEFKNNYIAILDAKGVPHKDRLLPAIQIIDPTQKVRMITPGIDFFPGANDWIFSFERLKGKQFFRYAAKGRYPFFETRVHDPFHFVKFSQYPHYAAMVKQAFMYIGAMPSKINWIRRGIWALEMLTLGDPAKKEQIKKFLWFRPAGNKTVEFKDYHGFYKMLPQNMLWTRGWFMVHFFRDHLEHYAGGMAEPSERQNYTEISGMQTLEHFLGAPNMKEVFFYDPVVARYFIQQSMTFMPDFLRSLLDMTKLSDSKLEILFKPYRVVNYQKNLDDLIRLQMARMEYALWKTSYHIGYSQWINDTAMAEKVDLNSPTMKLIRDAWGENSILYKVFSENIYRDSGLIDFRHLPHFHVF